jgi:hypothetical protein
MSAHEIASLIEHNGASIWQPRPDAQLEAVLIQFGRRSDVSPIQEAQLRAASTSDAKASWGNGRGALKIAIEEWRAGLDWQ